MWNLPPPPGFQGLKDELPLTMYEQHLPHWRQDGATYFVTFRLHDSLPQSKLRELRQMKAEWERKHRPPRSREALDNLARETMCRVEMWLDMGIGECALRSQEISAMVVERMQKDDGTLHELGCYVIMPNHVHAVVRPLQPNCAPLETILQQWKGGSARGINERLGRAGILWQQESFDRIIRDAEHLYRAVQYIGRNPSKAGLQPHDVTLWIRPEWVECGWDFVRT
jgi:REP element-mobilizing transposase RayT